MEQFESKNNKQIEDLIECQKITPNELSSTNDTDIKLIQRYVNREVGLIFTDEQKKYADCNHDGLITINDATLISKYITYNDKYLKGDANFDGILDSDDILVLQNIISQGESSIQFEPLRKNIASFLNGCEESFNINAITRMQTYISNIDTNVDLEKVDINTSISNGDRISGGSSKRLFVKIKYNGKKSKNKKYFNFNINYAFSKS